MTHELVRNASTIIVTPNRFTLILKLNYASRLWAPPGGLIDNNEVPLQTAKREFQEEVGDKLDLNKATEILSFISNNTVIYVIYTSQRFKISLSNEHSDYSFVKLDNILESNFLTNYSKCSFKKAFNMNYL